MTLLCGRCGERVNPFDYGEHMCPIGTRNYRDDDTRSVRAGTQFPPSAQADGDSSPSGERSRAVTSSEPRDRARLSGS